MTSDEFQKQFDASTNELIRGMTEEIKRLRQRAEAAERERDGFESWANTLESAAWQDGGFCPHCGADEVRKSLDVLEPDVAQAVRYCCACKQPWLETPEVHP